MGRASLISAHGGHSGQFCSHASDDLARIAREYVSKGFEMAGFTEHMPPRDPAFFYPEERAEGLTADDAFRRFERYFETARRLAAELSGEMAVLVGFETEAWPGYVREVADLRERFHPDYVVGSIHHVGGVPFDTNPEDYARACEAAGGIEAFYCQYLDEQLEMIESLRPELVGHLDLVRKFDEGYRERLKLPAVAARVLRNLDAIAEHGLSLDLNTGAWRRGQADPYPVEWIVADAVRRGINVLPGDDSHGVESVGAGIVEANELIATFGGKSDWRLLRSR